MQIAAVDAQAWTLDLRSPFAIATRTATQARNVLVRVQSDADGLAGLGESAPVTYVTGETVESVLAAIQDAAPVLVGLPIARLGPLLDIAQAHLASAPSACAGLEMAIYDLWARHWQMPLWHHFGARQKSIVTDLTIPLVPPDEASRLTTEAAAAGFRHFKIKVGDPRGPDADLARVAAIAAAVPLASLRIDANQAFEAEEALRFIRALSKFGAVIELIEQPVPKADIEALAYVTRHSSLPIFADEAAGDAASVRRLIEREAMDGVNIKLMKSGISGALEVITLCRLAGKKLMLGCMLESPLGISAAAQLAAGTGAFHFLDLDSHHLLAPLPEVSAGFAQSGGTLTVNDRPTGWGVGIRLSHEN